MNAEIIAVGSELLLGQIVNTNARFLSQQLAELGVNVYYHTVVGDNANRLDQALSIAESRSDIIIFTGGLGPTKDDLTKETISKHLDTPLVMNIEALNSIEYYFERTKRVMTDNNKKQALVLEGCHVLPNDHGMAPGMLYKSNNKIYILLPGPPKEMEPMFHSYCRTALLNEFDKNDRITSRVLRFFGIGEAALESEIDDIINLQTNPTIAPLASDGEVTLRLTAKHHDDNEAMRMLDDTEKNILSKVGQYLYGYDDTSLMMEVYKVLQNKGLTISSAESLTGGMFQSHLTSIDGASSIFNGGVVCYSNETKMNIVQVKPDTIKVHGSVSKKCAEELAENIANLMHTDVGISFTGVAGPNKLEGHSVGTVFIGISIKGKPTLVKKLELAGSRESIRLRSVKYGCHYLIKYLNEIQVKLS
ncbi:competence/damage-inducible protein A [Bacillus sp. CGMCC 1.16607]|uniref:competence/damage-inducible protein A n=1 Tax=Bacillus sp. CGMCC 1.16607 TaxID=3351842 RepID=UPI003636BCFE